MAIMNPWEREALKSNYSDDTAAAFPSPVSCRRAPARDPSGVIFPGIYSRSGLNAMNILTSVYMRPNKQINLGPVDDGCCILVSDLAAHDSPIVYASPAFTRATGYAFEDIRGRNCRFLQTPPGRPPAPDREGGVVLIKEALARCREVRVRIRNYRRDGSAFLNTLTLVTLPPHGGHYYCVGFVAVTDDLSSPPLPRPP